MSSDPGPIFVDANVLMYAHGAEHPLREPCQGAIARLGRFEVDACTSVEVHQEILHRYLSLRRPGQALRVSRSFALVVPLVLPVTRRDVDAAWNLMARYPGLHARDYVHAAVMMDNDLCQILSADAHFDRIDEIERIRPEAFAA